MALIAGPCVIESEKSALKLADMLAKLAARKKIPLVFKASYDKANRTSRDSFRGPGIERGLAILSKVRRETGLPVLTDVHETSQVPFAADAADALQIPAFLSRQTDLIEAAAATGKPVNIKKGQFMAPEDMRHAVAKARIRGGAGVMITERGVSFGYHNLIVDMRSFPQLSALGVPVIFDATHSAQLPGGRGGSSGGQREYIPVLARAACAAGIDGLFLEVHPRPGKALSDGPNSWPMDRLGSLWDQVMRIRRAAGRS